MVDEEIIIEPEFIEAAKAEMLVNSKLQSCTLCMHFDEEKKWCHFYRQPKQVYNYGSNCFVTNEIALKALLLQERKRSIHRKAVLQKKLDIMEALINAADLVRDDIQDMIVKSVEAKQEGNTGNIDILTIAKAYAVMQQPQLITELNKEK